MTPRIGQEPPNKSAAGLDVLAVTVGDTSRMSVRPSPRLDQELAAVKAGLLYADRVTLFSVRLHLDALPSEGVTTLPDDDNEREQRLAAWHAAGRDVYASLEEAVHGGTWAPSPEWDEFRLAVEARALDITDMAWAVTPTSQQLLLDRPFWRALVRGPNVPQGLMQDAVFDAIVSRQRREDVFPRAIGAAAPGTPEAALAARLVGDLEAFPAASMDAILDVRERLRPELIRFRAAISRAASTVEFDSNGDFSTEHVRRIYQEEVTPAQQELVEALHDLGARETLMRGVGSTLAAVGVVAGAAVSVAELAAAAGMPIGKAINDEIAFRRGVREQRRANPFAFLFDAGRLLRRQPGAR